MTYVFTDIEDSTVLWDRFPRAMSEALALHDEIATSTVAAWHGYVFATGGDGFGVAFASADDAASFATEFHRRLFMTSWPTPWPIRVRIGLHTGVAEERHGNYFGRAVNKAARVAASARGGQIVTTSTTAGLLDERRWQLAAMGSVRLSGFEQPERLMRLVTTASPDVADPVRAPGTVVGNVRRPYEDPIGRTREIDRLARAVQPGSLVTLAGPGGIGKTRLALAVAFDAAARFEDGGWLVELAAAETEDSVLPVVIDGLGLRLDSTASVPGIASAVGRQRRLIVLDNCEHVIEAAAALASRLGSSCPHVAILATSREPLAVSGEHVVEVRALDHVTTDGQVGPAVELFMRRMTDRVGPLPDVDADAVETICGRLDGVPLAIELAAARAAAVGVAAVRDGLDEAIDFTSHRRDIDPKHRSLHATVEWSFALLTPVQQQLLCDLSVFVAPFELPAAEAVGRRNDAHRSLVEPMMALVDKSLLTVRSTDAVRFHMLEIVRQFARQRSDAADCDSAVGRLVAHYESWVARVDALARGPREREATLAFIAEWDNLRAAFDHACNRGDVDRAASIVMHCLWWAPSRRPSEIAAWGDRLLATPGFASHPMYPIGAVAAHYRAGTPERAVRLIDDAVRFEREVVPAPEPWAENAQWFHIFLRSWTDDELHDLASRIGRRAGDSLFWQTQAALIDAHLPAMALVTLDRNDPRCDRYRTLVERARTLASRLGNPSLLAWAYNVIGNALELDDLEQAIKLYEHAFALAQSVGNLQQLLGNCSDLGRSLPKIGRLADAIRYIREALRAGLRAGDIWTAHQVALQSFPVLVHSGRAEIAYLVGLVRGHNTPTRDAWFFAAATAEDLERELSRDTIERVRARRMSITPEELTTDVLAVLDDLHDSNRVEPNATI